MNESVVLVQNELGYNITECKVLELNSVEEW